MRYARSKATDISKKVKDAVWERDEGRCVVCDCNQNVMPNAHIISRVDGGLGVEENIVTLCTGLTENNCHFKYDFGTAEERAEIFEKIEKHMKFHYPNWDPKKYVYKKGIGYGEFAL